MDVEGVREFAGPSLPSWATDGAAWLAASGAGRHLRMAALLRPLVETPNGPTDAALRAAGVPRPAIRMLAPFRPRARTGVLGAWAAAVVRAGAAPLVRADIAVRPGLGRQEEAAALDVADGRVADGPALIGDLGGEVGTEHWWYAVAALGLLRRSDAVPGLLATFRRIRHRRPVGLAVW
jgi:hypothetical protein